MVALIGVVVAVFEVADYFIEAEKRVPGYTSLAVLLLVLAGFIIVSIGVVGLYVGRIFEQVKNRPLFLIDQQAGGGRRMLHRRQHVHHLPPARNRKRADDPLPVALHQSRERLLGEALGMPADPRVGGAAADPPDQRQAAAGQVAHRLGHDHPIARGGQHPLEHARSVREEVIEAGLEDDHVGAGQRLSAGGEIELAGVHAAPAQARHEPWVDVDADIAGGPSPQVAQVQRPRSAAALEHRGAVRHLHRPPPASGPP